jgi:hypothetical protein
MAVALGENTYVYSIKGGCHPGTYLNDLLPAIQNLVCRPVPRPVPISGYTGTQINMGTNRIGFRHRVLSHVQSGFLPILIPQFASGNAST